MCIHVRHVQVTGVWQDVKNKMDRWATCTRREIQSSRVRKQSYSLFVPARRDVQQDS